MDLAGHFYCLCGSGSILYGNGLTPYFKDLSGLRIDRTELDKMRLSATRVAVLEGGEREHGEGYADSNPGKALGGKGLPVHVGAENPDDTQAKARLVGHGKGERGKQVSFHWVSSRDSGVCPHECGDLQEMRSVVGGRYPAG